MQKEQSKSHVEVKYIDENGAEVKIDGYILGGFTTGNTIIPDHVKIGTFGAAKGNLLAMSIGFGECVKAYKACIQDSVSKHSERELRQIMELVGAINLEFMEANMVMEKYFESHQ